jgi:hypothetical protein
MVTVPASPHDLNDLAKGGVGPELVFVLRASNPVYIYRDEVIQKSAPASASHGKVKGHRPRANDWAIRVG